MNNTSEYTREKRQEAVNFVIANNRLEGLSMSKHAQEKFKEFVDGTITLEQLEADILG